MKNLKPLNPYSLEPTGEYPILEYAQIRAKVDAARRAQAVWRRIDPGQRVEYLRAGLQYFGANRASIAKDITVQMGKPVWQSENELKGFFERAEWMLGAAEGVLAPDLLPEKPGFIRRIEHVPLGVVLIIAPWNYPLLTAVNGVAAALLSGNAVLLKHSSLTPAVGEHFARAFGRTGQVEDLLQSLVAGHADIEQ
ncbi:MAG TPA: aldehyde dehydrogenase family protein, partial [Fibrobacteria bacterium]|nr:aldehyde dehydrogenase family protein [Fibrobacteria bacterium]